MLQTVNTYVNAYFPDSLCLPEIIPGHCTNPDRPIRLCKINALVNTLHRAMHELFHSESLSPTDNALSFFIHVRVDECRILPDWRSHFRSSKGTKLGSSFLGTSSFLYATSARNERLQVPTETMEYISVPTFQRTLQSIY